MSRHIRPVVFALALFVSVGVPVVVGRAQQGGQQNPPAQPAKPPTGQPQQTPPQGQQPQGQQPTFRLPINYVRVDVIISDKQGNPVNDLTSADFDVTEDGKPQKVDSFKFINLGTATQQQLNATETPREIRNDFDEQSEAARDDVRIFAIFLDDYHVRLGSSMGVRAPLERFLQTQLGPNDLVEVMYPLSQMTDLLLTRDHDAVARVIEQFAGRKYDYRPRNDIEQQYANYPATTIEQIRNQVSLSALKGLVTHLGGLREGRKSVILVSEGYTNVLPPQLRDPIASMPGYGNPNRNDPMATDTGAAASANFFSSIDILSDLRNVYDAANRANTAIYSLDPRGLATNEFDLSQPAINQQTDHDTLEATQDTLRALSTNTDARAIVNRNDLAGGLKQILRDSSAYYLLGYNSSLATADGKFHEIKVRVKRPGVEVRARKGYWAPTEEDRAKALAPPRPGPPTAVTKALSAIVEPPRGRVVRTWIGTARGENGKTRVTFVWEPVVTLPGAQPGDRPARVSLIASGPGGQAYFRGRVPDVALASTASPASPGTAAATTAGPSRVVFDAPPGKLQLRVSVEGSREQVLDSEVRDLEIPDLTGPQVMLTTPAVYSARTARDFRTLTSDPDAVPTAGREFSRTERLLIRFDAYGPGYSVPGVTARLLNRTGQAMTDLTAQPAAKYPQEHSIDLPLAGLAAGEYLIEIKAKGEAGEATELVAIRITA
jgi:VWFA-related protein